MTECGCSDGLAFDGMSKTYKRVLWTVIAINATMFAVEATAGLTSGSMALQADALDFLGDSFTYTVTLLVIGRPIRWRAAAAFIKGISLAMMGSWVLGSTVYRVFILGTPDEFVMGTVGILAFAANAISAILLLRFRNGDANVRSVWLCSRNDAIGNLAVVLAAAGVMATNTPWPDLVVAFIMATLFLYSALQIIQHARADLQGAAVGLPSAVKVE